MPRYRKVNEKFFDKWTPESAYIFGLLMADGTITVNPRGSRYVEFVSIDKELVNNLKYLLDSDHKISIKKKPSDCSWKRAYRIQIGNKRLLGRLNKLGLGDKKKNKLRFPKVPVKLYCHFVRGFFDGDGCVCIGRYYSSERSKYKQYANVVFTAKN
ncbi:LAGLIDADG family homing endonuclease, partial [bacterium]|nr:LAGLIDADG family homing endonuclease [bacterium]